MMKNYTGKAVAIALFCVTVCVSMIVGCTGKTDEESAAPLKVSLLKVGKADAIVVQTDEKTMVIDTGEEEDGEEVVMFLENQGIKYVDTLIITHFDRDHVGGADTLVESMEVGQVFLPAYEGNRTEYFDFMEALKQKNITPQELTQPVELEMGMAKVLIEPPLSYETDGSAAEFDNNFSLITTVTYGENSLLFMGDAEKQRIRQWISGDTAADCDFLKVPHHGVYNTALKELLEAVTPEYAAICSSNKHPADVQTLELLKQQSIRPLQTKDGNITIISDGSRLEMSQELEH